MPLFNRRNLEEYTDSLAAYMPGGELFASRSVQDSNFRNLLRGLAGEIFRANGALIEYDTLPDVADKFLPEWESTLGIPDGCFEGDGTILERRRDVLVKLASLGVQTIEDFQSLANVFDLTANVIPGEDYPGLLAYPKFTMVVEWLGATPEESAQINIVSCLFIRLKPANVELEIVNLNRFAQCDENEMECGEAFAQCNNSLF